MTIRVRLAREEDHARIAELTIGAYRRLEVDHLGDGYEEAIRDTARRAATTELYVAVDGGGNDAGNDEGNVVGAVTFVVDPASPWLEWAEPGETQIRLLAVDPDAQGRGIGEALVGHCLDRARELGRPVVLHTTQFMARAHRLYARLGFVPRPDRDDAETFAPFVFHTYTWAP